MAGKRKTREAKARALAAIQAGDSSTSHARACGGPETTVEQRVRHIAELMTSGGYDGYVTRFELGKAWGIADSTVRQYASEAQRLVAFDPEERERMRISLAAECRELKRRASVLRNGVTGLPDFASALNALKTEAAFIGVDIETKRIELSGPNGGPIEHKDVRVQAREMSDAELEAVLPPEGATESATDSSSGTGAPEAPEGEGTIPE